MERILDYLLDIRRPFIILLHLVLVIVANAAAFWLRFDGEIPDEFFAVGLQLLPWLLIVRLVVFIPFRLFEGLWKYTSLWDLRNIILGVATSTAVFCSIAALSTDVVRYPRSIYIIDAILLICFMTGIRLTRRIYSETLRPRGGRRVLVYGAGDAGVLIVRDMRQNEKFRATPIGFVDDDYRKIGRRIHGVPVLGGRKHLARILSTHAPEELLIAIPSASRETLRDIVRLAEPYKLRITTLPKLHEIIGERVEVGQIRQLRVEDLLAREPVGLSYEPIRHFLEGKRVLVTGAGGSIGAELCRQIAAANPARLCLLDRSENGLFYIHNELVRTFPQLDVRPILADITEASRIDQVFDTARPQVVFHAAAHKHVPLMEDNPSEAVKNNVRGTRIVAESALRYLTERFVLISTDKAVNPTSVMGATKRVAELLVERLSGSNSTRFSAVRFGNVLASNGSVVPTFLEQIAKGGPVTVTHPEMRRFFMLIPEAVQLVLHAAALKDTAPLFVLEMGEQIKIVDMARDLIRLSGYIPDKDIAIEFTGVRPGEKLFEELIGGREFAEPSSLPKILRVQKREPTGGAAQADALARLEKLALDGRDAETLRELCAIVTDFTPCKTEAQPA